MSREFDLPKERYINELFLDICGGRYNSKMAEQIQKRQIACKARIGDVINGKYVKEEGWQPNYIITNDGKKISRINLIASVVLKPANENLNYQNIVLDDGSGKISVRSFEENEYTKDINVGDVVLLIGRPREYGNEKYIVPEIIKKVENPLWIKVRNLELKKGKTIAKNTINDNEEPILKEEPIEVIENGKPSNKICELIKIIDTGEGADIEEVISKSKFDEAEKIIRNLLEEGEIFEVKPGKLKILE